MSSCFLSVNATGSANIMHGLKPTYCMTQQQSLAYYDIWPNIVRLLYQSAPAQFRHSREGGNLAKSRACLDETPRLREGEALKAGLCNGLIVL